MPVMPATLPLVTAYVAMGQYVPDEVPKPFNAGLWCWRYHPYKVPTPCTRKADTLRYRPLHHEEIRETRISAKGQSYSIVAR